VVEFQVGLFHAEFLAGIKFNDLAAGGRRFVNGLHDGKFLERIRLTAKGKAIDQAAFRNGRGGDGEGRETKRGGEVEDLYFHFGVV
jgi:hypothetical protein